MTRSFKLWAALGGALVAANASCGEEPVIRGGLHPRARACYDAGLTEDPSQQGRVVITIRVGASGEVTDASTAQCMGVSPKTCACIEAGARKLVFQPPGGGGSTINAPMNFVKQGSSDRASAAAERAFVRNVLPEAQRCYRAALAANASVQGKAKYYASVDRTGQVTSVSAEPEQRLPQTLLECVANAIKAVKLPPSTDLRVLLYFLPTVE